jgi:hypothetical protein
MNIGEAIKTVRQMRSDGMIDNYAIGGAVGATFYLEPVATMDVDIFVAFQTARGSKVEREYIIVAGWPVQFLHPTGPLVQEALTEAVEKDVAGAPARVFTAEHLAAIALQTGRPRDKASPRQFIEAGALGAARFQAILSRHDLIAAWRRFEQQFLAS